MSLSREQVQWVANLARLELSDADLTRLTGELSAVLDYVEQLREVPTEGVEPLAHPLNLQNIFRADEPGQSLPVDAALSNAPERSGDCFAVPSVLE